MLLRIHLHSEISRAFKLEGYRPARVKDSRAHASISVASAMAEREGNLRL